MPLKFVIVLPESSSSLTSSSPTLSSSPDSPSAPLLFRRQRCDVKLHRLGRCVLQRKNEYHAPTLHR
ncbi:unnamed protein product [Eruca vesicaria subsp. sativa]|uniref:Uncharacterized protein n=1 Tax=Eruca vesicaria subsp. sativa TaxID=29727 RepID=A0ABC8JV15_ERUVS|nr:unnamed protein product [Eruca vesicaria subsp. sativa]